MNGVKWATYAADYGVYGTWLALCGGYVSFIGGGILTPIMASCMIVCTMCVNVARDQIMSKVLPSSVVSPYKAAYKVTKENLLYIAKILCFIAVAVYAQTYFGLFHFTMDAWTIPLVQFQFLSISVLKDVCFMAPLHKAMHTQRWWWLHKVHHRPRKEIQAVNAFYFDLPDIVIEDVGGPAMLAIIWYLATGSYALHFGTYILQVIAEHNVHSLNPYSVVYFNPLVDAIFKGNLTHNLHHVMVNKYYTITPYSHIFPSQRKADIAAYCKVFQTTVEF